MLKNKNLFNKYYIQENLIAVNVKESTYLHYLCICMQEVHSTDMHWGVEYKEHLRVFGRTYLIAIYDCQSHYWHPMTSLMINKWLLDSATAQCAIWIYKNKISQLNFK